MATGRRGRAIPRGHQSPCRLRALHLGYQNLTVTSWPTTRRCGVATGLHAERGSLGERHLVNVKHAFAAELSDWNAWARGTDAPQRLRGRGAAATRGAHARPGTAWRDPRGAGDMPSPSTGTTRRCSGSARLSSEAAPCSRTPRSGSPGPWGDTSSRCDAPESRGGRRRPQDRARGLAGQGPEDASARAGAPLRPRKPLLLRRASQPGKAHSHPAATECAGRRFNATAPGTQRPRPGRSGEEHTPPL